ncbi:unnamed protein product [Zymoseptoria tritici ST99CH_1A5]|uniref:Granulins domain-containing protein n=1 Tax=Zymoseptoria tritici ST99CH_1A5 TaxID=1276529 RepID=A0A1Y6LIQ4_ZYMTR|nr:unnamed protein product [Zymoseptoria tritici ST99CH_1A5]
MKLYIHAILATAITLVSAEWQPCAHGGEGSKSSLFANNRFWTHADHYPGKKASCKTWTSCCNVGSQAFGCNAAGLCQLTCETGGEWCPADKMCCPTEGGAACFDPKECIH